MLDVPFLLNARIFSDRDNQKKMETLEPSMVPGMELSDELASLKPLPELTNILNYVNTHFEFTRINA